MPWLVAEYQEETGRRAGRSLAHLPAQTGPSTPWVEWQVRNPWRCIVWAADQKIAEEIARVRGVDRLPDLPLDRTLGDLTRPERTSLSQLVEALGYAEPLTALRAYAKRGDLKLTDVRLATVLQLLSHRRPIPRRDENGDVAFDIGERDAAKVLPGLAAGGAIDTTSLDTFDGTGSLSGSWTGDSQGFGDDTPTRVSGEAQDPNTSDYASAFWNEGDTSSADSSVWATLGGTVGEVEIMARMQDEGTSGFDGYAAWFNGSTLIEVYEYTNGSSTTLGASVSTGIGSGDSFGLDCLGTDVDLYEDTGSGFSKVADRSDATYSAAGKLSFYVRNSSTITEFGGGPGFGDVPPPPAVGVPLRTLVGVGT